jgi:hypothetical protein
VVDTGREEEADAPELVPPPALQVVFERGQRVGELAQAEFPGGVLVEREYFQIPEKIADTQAALAAKAPAVYEASFQADDVFVAVDILERRRGGHRIIEVKSTLDVKEQFLPDVAIQLHVVRKSGLDVKRVEVMHLNRACRFPDLSNLFLREDVTAEAEDVLPSIPGHLRRMRCALDGPLPKVEPGSHCADPYGCPFTARCWPEVPDDHVTTRYKGGKRAAALLAEGIASIHDIPADAPLPTIAARQVRAVQTDKDGADSARRRIPACRPRVRTRPGHGTARSSTATTARNRPGSSCAAPWAWPSADSAQAGPGARPSKTPQAWFGGWRRQMAP